MYLEIEMTIASGVHNFIHANTYIHRDEKIEYRTTVDNEFAAYAYLEDLVVKMNAYGLWKTIDIVAELSNKSILVQLSRNYAHEAYSEVWALDNTDIYHRPTGPAFTRSNIAWQQQSTVLQERWHIHRNTVHRFDSILKDRTISNCLKYLEEHPKDGIIVVPELIRIGIVEANPEIEENIRALESLLAEN